MDRNTAERRFARCSQLWDAARSRRTFRTHQQDQDADKAARRNRRKARVYTALADAGLICAVLAVAVTFNHLTPRPADDMLLITTIALAFGAHELLGRLWTNAFGPSINRLRGLPATDSTETEATR